VHFVNNKEGWAVGKNGTVIHTSNGGNKWELQQSGIIEPFLDVYFIDSNRGWAVGFGPIASTEDGGKTWKCQPNKTGKVLWGIQFDAENRGWMVGADGIILYSGDEGKTWIPQSSGTDNWLFDICNSGKTLWAVGLKGTILKLLESSRS